MSGLEWSENVNSQGKHYLYSETGPHSCKPVGLKPNPILVATDHVIEGGKKINLGFWVDIREEKKAQLVTAECLRVGLNPFKVRLERKGDFIIIH